MRTASPVRRGILFGVGAAVTFGISAPLAKVLLNDDVPPQLLAGLLYWMSRRPDAPGPEPSVAGSAAPQTHPPPSAPDDGGKPATEPENSFIVCPGNPRCP